MLYWQLLMRWELGVFQVFLLLFASAIGGFALWVAETRLTQGKLWKAEPPQRPSLGTWARLPLYAVLVAVMSLLLTGRGRPVGGLVVFDDQGIPQRATMQLVVRAGGKIKVQHEVLRAIGSDGSTLALHRVGYEGGRKPLRRASSFWDGEMIRSTETLDVLATAADVRRAVPALRQAESRFLHVQGNGSAAFQRRDGAEILVGPADVVADEDLGPAGCLVDILLRGRVDVPGLIEPRSVPWAGPGPGCPSVPPAGVQLLVSDDAAFGEVHPLLTLRDESGRRWRVELRTASQAEDPSLIGAVPFAEALAVVVGDGDELVFARLDWADGATVDIVRW